MPQDGPSRRISDWRTRHPGVARRGPRLVVLGGLVSPLALLGGAATLALRLAQVSPLAQTPEWELIFHDAQAALFVRRQETNASASP